MSTARDTIVVGASAGGVDALPRVIAQLPSDLPAAVLVVQHLAAIGEPLLVTILARQAQMPVVWAGQGDRITPGHVYVGPPDVHLLIVDDHVQLAGGPRENHARPAIDRLFRSAAAKRGPRTIGVLLTGMLDDGVAGLRAIQEAGGLVIVQDPKDAAYPELPARALQVIDPDRVLPIDAIGGALVRMLREPAAEVPPPARIAIEAELDRAQLADPAQLELLGVQTAISCPECHGPTWDLGDPKQHRYRCYLGHVATAREVLRLSASEVETAMWSAIRALHDRAATYESLATDARGSGAEQAREIYERRAADARKQANLARAFMLEVIATSTDG